MRGREVLSLSRSDSRWRGERQAKKDLRNASAQLIVELRAHAARDAGSPLPDADVERIGWVAKSCARIGAPLLYLSSASVFSGGERRPYSEADEPDGADPTAIQLQQLEASVASHGGQVAMLRTGLAFSHSGSNLLSQTLQRLLDDRELCLDGGNRFALVAAEDLARVLSAMLDQYSVGLDSWGIFHYASTEQASEYEFAEAALAALSQFVGLQTMPSLRAEAQQEPPLTRHLDCGRLRSTFAIRQLPWRAYMAPAVRLYAEMLRSEKKS